MDLKKLQQDALLRMINLNQEISDSEIIWKVLIYDKFGQDIISPSLRLGDLRSSGITLHMSLASDRQPIPDVPAIYFLEPTAENVAVLSQDLKKQLYDSFYVNFTSTLPRALLEDLAAQAVASNSQQLISQVYDQYLNYVCLEPQLFSLEIPRTYQILNSPTTPETVIEKLVDQIASSLFSVIVTLGNVPIIKCPKGNVAEAVAKKLDSKLRNNILNSRASLFANQVHLTRPVLVLLDRDLDLTSLLTHTWTYSTLFHDLLDMKLNRVTFMADEKGRQVEKKYDIDVTDPFWLKNAASPLPEVGVCIDEETKSYHEQVNRMGADATTSDPNDFSATTGSLASTMQKLPELRMRQKVLDMHTVAATSLLNSIMQRQLDSFIKMEESVGKLTTPAIIQVIKEEQKLPEDKLRLALIYILSCENISNEDINKIETALTETQAEVSSIKFIKK
ncbi:Vesicle trafficking between the ER and Golgi [Boothiomyces macroporosus]|uniref:Vesicle trafficking between the ER and Golgi n=1 Tax=Boothiomyces macroporosus TaxID=261099 RepID=A0AAD5ULK6_9FUNG|nr:Vesicle trafficking between the ER and Golgi [Boothiomyces macroporosus]